MKTTKSYESVSDLVADVVEDKVLRDEIQAEIRKQSLATTLFTMRVKSGISQQEMAKKISRSQSWVSKLEHSGSDKIAVEDLERYSRALEVNLIIMFQRPMNAVESVKYHFFQIKKHLDQLLELAKDDDEIRDGVNRFHNEWLYNALTLFLEGKAKLRQPAKPKKAEALIVVGPEGPPPEREFAEFRKKIGATR